MLRGVLSVTEESESENRCTPTLPSSVVHTFERVCIRFASKSRGVVFGDYRRSTVFDDLALTSPIRA